MHERGDVQVVPFTSRHQDPVRALVLSGLAERWGTIDASLNNDLVDVAASYAAGCMLVAVRGRRVVGCGAIMPTGDGGAEILRMSVASTERRGGVGRMIVDELVKVARSWSVRRVTCETSSGWTSAVEFYVGCGFEVAYEEDGPFGRDTHFSLELDRG